MIDRQYRARSQHPFWPVRPRTRGTVPAFPRAASRLAWLALPGPGLCYCCPFGTNESDASALPATAE